MCFPSITTVEGGADERDSLRKLPIAKHTMYITVLRCDEIVCVHKFVDRVRTPFHCHAEVAMLRTCPSFVQMKPKPCMIITAFVIIPSHGTSFDPKCAISMVFMEFLFVVSPL